MSTFDLKDLELTVAEVHHNLLWQRAPEAAGYHSLGEMFMSAAALSRCTDGALLSA